MNTLHCHCGKKLVKPNTKYVPVKAYCRSCGAVWVWGFWTFTTTEGRFLTPIEPRATRQYVDLSSPEPAKKQLALVNIDAMLHHFE